MIKSDRHHYFRSGSRKHNSDGAFISLLPPCKGSKITPASEEHSVLFLPARLARLKHKPTGLSSFLMESDAISPAIQKGNWGTQEATWLIQHHQESLGWSVKADSFESWAHSLAPSSSFQPDCIMNATVDALQTFFQKANICLFYPKCEMCSVLPHINWQSDVHGNLSSNPDNFFVSWILGTHLPHQARWKSLNPNLLLRAAAAIRYLENIRNRTNIDWFFPDLFSHYSAWVLSHLKTSLVK